jgi:hypothetical protein
MKKILNIAATVFILGFASGAFAIPAEIPASIPADSTQAVAKGGTQVTIGGELRVRGVSTHNISDPASGAAPAAGAGSTEKQGKGK